MMGSLLSVTPVLLAVALNVPGFVTDDGDPPLSNSSLLTIVLNGVGFCYR